jgi:hypothetical protein
MFNRRGSSVSNSHNTVGQQGDGCRTRWPWQRPVAGHQLYQLCDRLHEGRSVRVSAPEIAGTVAGWLADLGVHSPWVEQLQSAVQAGDWGTVRSICEHLSVDISFAK